MLDTQRDWGRIFPGEKARVELASNGVLLILPRENAEVLLNGRVLEPVGLMVQLSGVLPGPNLLRVDGVAYHFNPGIDGSLNGIYRLDASRGSLIPDARP